jgi:hypothetical protein
MHKPSIVLADLIDCPIEAAIGGGLDRFNDVVTGISDRRPLAVVLKDPETPVIRRARAGSS